MSGLVEDAWAMSLGCPRAVSAGTGMPCCVRNLFSTLFSAYSALVSNSKRASLARRRTTSVSSDATYASFRSRWVLNVRLGLEDRQKEYYT